jgi:hypothetical protein
LPAVAWLEYADSLIFKDAAAGALGMFHLAHGLVLFALQTAAIGRLTILITGFIEVFA